MKKRFLNLFLALILVVCVLPMAVGAVAFEDCKHKNTLTARAEREATCTEVGYSQTHMYCSACHTSMVKVGNAYQAISPVIEATGHKWDKNGECTECDATCMHANKETVPGYAATCTKEGRTDGQRCADCKKPLKSQYKIAKKDHVFKGKETIVKEATCTEKGSKTVQCKTCTETTTVEIPVAEHSWKYKAAEDATCVTAGWKGGDVCATCGEARTASNVIAATGNHDFEYDSKVSDATCTAKRVNLYKCKDCEVTEEREDGSLLDHAWSSWTITKQPTCTEDGLKERKCNNCDAVETVAATKTGHS